MPVGTRTVMRVLFQVLTVASVPFGPLKDTLPFPCVEPKFAPLIVTVVPHGPDVGLMLLTDGAGSGVGVSVGAPPPRGVAVGAAEQPGPLALNVAAALGFCELPPEWVTSTV